MEMTEAFAKVIIEMAEVCYSEGQGPEDKEAEGVLMTWIQVNYPHLVEQYKYMPWDSWAKQKGE